MRISDFFAFIAQNEIVRPAAPPRKLIREN